MLNSIWFNAQYKVWVSTDGKIYRQNKENQLQEYSRSITNSGYYQIGLCIDGKPKAKLVHRLVAETFLRNPHRLRDVDHIDANKLNNNVLNLRFTTHSFNCARNHKKLTKEHIRLLTAATVNAHLGKKWFTNGVKNIIGEPGKCPEGYWPGKTNHKKMVKPRG